MLKQSAVRIRLPDGVGSLGDLTYMGIAALHPPGVGATPRRKPRDRPRGFQKMCASTVRLPGGASVWST
jgi:hypothetical protein